jgi:acyl-CoA thioester hydrolase
MPIDSTRIFFWPVRVYWEDTDAGGIVFYANYLKFMERARTEWLRTLGISQSVLRDQSSGMFVVSDAHLHYKRPTRLDDQLLVTAQVVQSSKITLTITQEIRLLPHPSPAEKQLNLEHLTISKIQLDELPMVCHGDIRIAWVDAVSMQPARIPNSIREVLQ